MRHLSTALFFRTIVAQSPAPTSWTMLVFVFLLAMLGTPQSLVIVPPTYTALLLGAPVLLPT